MTYPDDYINKVICEDCLEVMKDIPSDSVDLVITSPPYWGLRDYGIGNNQLGLEKHPTEYIKHLMIIFKEIKRVLKKSSSFYLNMGDSYFSPGVYKSNYGQGSGKNVIRRPVYDKMREELNKGTIVRPKSDGKWLQPKQLLGIPERIMIAMQNDGWILRNKIIWHKKNPMPSSVKDRRNTVWEYLYHFVKSRKYYYDLDAIRVPHIRPDEIRILSSNTPKSFGGNSYPGGSANREGRILTNYISGKNPGDVIHLSTQPFPEAHFATFPEDLVKDPILSSCPEWICVKCGNARVRINKSLKFKEKLNNIKNNFSEKELLLLKQYENRNINLKSQDVGFTSRFSNYLKLRKIVGNENSSKTIGWTECSCNAEFVGGICLDPFGGSGTVGVVAVRLNRRFIIIDIKQEYCDMANKRIDIELEKKRQMELCLEEN